MKMTFPSCARGGDRLIGAFSAGGDDEFASQNGFTRLRNAVELDNHVRIGTANNKNAGFRHKVESNRDGKGFRGHQELDLEAISISKANEVEKEHRAQQAIGAFGGVLELFPDEHSPESANHGRALTQAIGKGGAGLGAGDDAKGHADTPNHAAENANQVEGGHCLW